MHRLSHFSSCPPFALLTTGFSEFRQIPDAQEVYLDQTSDLSFIFEILDRVEPKDPRDAARYARTPWGFFFLPVSNHGRFHFDSIADDNSATSSTVNEILVPKNQPVSPPHTPTPIVLHGAQSVSKFNMTKDDIVDVYLALYRLTELPHDIVFTLNMPLTTSTNESVIQTMKEMFGSMAESLIIKDFGLFGSA